MFFFRNSEAQSRQLAELKKDSEENRREINKLKECIEKMIEKPNEFPIECQNALATPKNGFSQR